MVKFSLFLKCHFIFGGAVSDLLNCEKEVSLKKNKTKKEILSYAFSEIHLNNFSISCFVL